MSLWAARLKKSPYHHFTAQAEYYNSHVIPESVHFCSIKIPSTAVQLTAKPYYFFIVPLTGFLLKLWF
jgi:hypothetical protein